MRLKILFSALVLFILSLPVVAQDAGCQPDLAGIISTLQQAQTAVDGGDTQAALAAITDARSSLALEEAKCINYAPETVGDKRTNPVPFGERHAIEQASLVKASLEFVEFNPHPDPIELMGMEAPPGKRFISARFTLYCDGSPDETCPVSSNPFTIVGSENTRIGGTYKIPADIFGPTLYGGGNAEHTLVFVVGEDEDDFVIVHNDFQGSTYFALS